MADALLKAIKNAVDTLLLPFKYIVKFLFYYRVSPKTFTVLPHTPFTGKVSVAIVTHGVLPFFRRCLENAIAYAGIDDVEFLVFDNNAGKETKAYLASITDHRIRVITSDVNIGLNGYHALFKHARGDLLVCMDHDVIAFPPDWLRTLCEDYVRVPDVRFLAADVVVDEHTDGARWPLWTYQRVEKDGMRMLFGAVGGWCAVTDRETYDAVGGFPFFPKEVYYLHDKYYIRKLLLKGYKIGIDQNVRVYHARGLASAIADEGVREGFLLHVDEWRKKSYSK